MSKPRDTLTCVKPIPATKRVFYVLQALTAEVPAREQPEESNQPHNTPWHLRNILSMHQAQHLAKHQTGRRCAMTHRWTNPSKGAPYQQRKAALQRDNNKCVKCGNTEHLEVDHILNVARGGTHNLDNLQTLCHHCHHTKTQWESGAWRRKIKRSPRTPIGLAE